jgi:hypothetical protein
MSGFKDYGRTASEANVRGIVGQGLCVPAWAQAASHVYGRGWRFHRSLGAGRDAAGLSARWSARTSGGPAADATAVLLPRWVHDEHGCRKAR